MMLTWHNFRGFVAGLTSNGARLVLLAEAGGGEPPALFLHGEEWSSFSSLLPLPARKTRGRSGALTPVLTEQ